MSWNNIYNPQAAFNMYLAFVFIFIVFFQLSILQPATLFSTQKVDPDRQMAQNVHPSMAGSAGSNTESKDAGSRSGGSNSTHVIPF
jgi:hypothetical protein